MKILNLLFIILFLNSCKNSENNQFSKQSIISGCYYVESEPNNQSGCIYIFSENEINYFDKDSESSFQHKATWRYYIKGKKIYTCLPYIDICEENNFDEHFSIISIDTIEDEQILKLESLSYPINLTLKKELHLKKNQL